ncbi:hypothetical protein [Undibacterium sp.]|uniref:hypothetical protein n=1 Tax=Undibacterium sp. TaxID=1914977 RepID=UPI003753C7EB
MTQYEPNKEELEQEVQRLEEKLAREKESHNLTVCIVAYLIWLAILVGITKDPTSGLVIFGGFFGAFVAFHVLPKILKTTK